MLCIGRLAIQTPCAPELQGIDKAQLIDDVRKALYASKICSYAQGMNIIKAKSGEKQWDIDLGALARIWKVCSLRVVLPLLCPRARPR